MQKLEVKKQEEERNQSVDKLNALLNEKSRIKDNLLKFRLLRKNYESDIERLEFIEQSHELTAQLADIKCPVCNGTIKHEITNIDKEVYFSAISKEKLKLQAYLFDLQGTIEDFENDLSKIGEVANKEKENIQNANSFLEKQANSISKTLLDYEKYLEIWDKVSQIKQNKKKLNDMNIRINELSTKINNTKESDNKVDIKKLNDELMREFSNLVQMFLEEWNFMLKSDVQEVNFENKSNDVIVCSKTKASFGKGARAVINSAFIISIMKYCITRGLSHPGFSINNI